MSSFYDHSDATPPAGPASVSSFKIAEKKYQLHMEQHLKRTKNGRMRGGKLVAQPTDLSDVIDIRSPPQQTTAIATHTLECQPPEVLRKDDVVDHSINLSTVPATGQPQHDAATYHHHQQQQQPCPTISITGLTFPAHPGLTVFPAALPAVLQLQLMRAALQDWPEPPTRTNHTAVYGLTLHGLFAAAQAGLALIEHPNGQRLEQQQRQQQEVLAQQQQQPDPAIAAHRASAVVPPANNSACCVTSSSMCSSSGCCHTNQQASTSAAAAWSCGPSGCMWSTSGKGPKAALLLRKLRWASLGPPFNWTARVYEPHAPHRPLPQALITTATFFAELSNRSHSSSSSNSSSSSGAGCDGNASATAGNCNHSTAGGSSAAAAAPYTPDVALVNYYHAGDTLNGHRDDVERDMTQPIVTMSLGCDAVFLMGGNTRDESPTALLLRSGDVVVLGGPARSCYHGVPRILHERRLAPELLKAAEVLGEGFRPVVQYMQQCRVNISVRATL